MSSYLSQCSTRPGVGQLEGARALRCAEDVAPLVADVPDNDVAGVLELLPLAGLEGDGGVLEADGLVQQLLPAGVTLAELVGHGDGPLVLSCRPSGAPA